MPHAREAPYTARGVLHTGLTIAAVLCAALMTVRIFNLFAVACMAVALAIAAHVVRPYRLPRGEHARLFAANTVVTVGAVLLTLAIVELGARVLLYPSPPQVALYDIDLANTFDLRPNARGTIPLYPDTGPPEVIGVQVSPQGVRGPVVPPKTPGEFRVVLAGDSFVFGYGVEQADTIAVQLERLLRHAVPGRDVTVINLGVIGTTATQHLGYLRERGFDFEPDLVIESIFLGNDVVELMADNGVQPVAYGPDLEGRYFSTLLLGTRRYEAEHWLAQHSRAYFTLRRRIGRNNVFLLLAEGLRFLPRIEIAQWNASAERPVRWEVNLAAWYPELTAGFDELIERIAEMRDECRSREVEFASFIVPLPEEVVPQLYEEQVAPFAEPIEYEAGKGTRFVQNALADRGIALIDVDDALLRHPAPETLYFLFDGHTTPAGNAVIAETLRDHITRHYLVTE